MDGNGVVLSPQKKLRVDDIKAETARLGQVTKTDLECACRKRTFSIPRQAAMYLARQHTRCSYPQIGRMFGDRDHTTALFAFRKVSRIRAAAPKDRRESDRLLLALVEEAEKTLLPAQAGLEQSQHAQEVQVTN